MGFMSHALKLARRAVGKVSPNPPVGVVIVKDGVVIGKGYTQVPGKDHAEIVALKQAGKAARGSILYTSLEPCNHHGRTPPCTEAIIDAGITEVHAAMLDPNPAVTGGGMNRFSEEGISIRMGECEAESRKLLESYVKYVTTGMPFVTAKFAMSLDGKIATRDGDSKWISGDKARWEVHRIRAAADAIMVGINTVLSDDPKLTARDKRGTALDHQPLRIVLDSRGRIPLSSQMILEPGNTLVVSNKINKRIVRSLEEVGVDSISLPGEGGLVDLVTLLKHLGLDRGITSLCVEGGSTVLGSMFDLGLVDKVIAFVSPVIIGGNDAPAPVGGTGFDLIQDSLRLERIRWNRYGRDIAITGYC